MGGISIFCQVTIPAIGTTLAAGTDNQVFCYDDQHRLTWAGSTGTPNCGTSLTPGSLTSANYTQSFTYDTLDRLQSGPLGSYTYGDSAHLHAATSIANGGVNAYSASYDAGGNMACRAADGSTMCSGTPTGAQLTFDNEGRLAAWQNTPTSPTSSDSFLYDGEGNRVEQQTTTNGSIITSTVYVAGGLEEITSTGSTTTLTKYFGANGLPTAERVGTNGPLAYLATDGQGSVSETLDSSGNVTSAQLYTPYGNVRYSSGSSPTSLGYTGQRADSATGLDYYHARYYDPVAGQFISADAVNDGLNRYGYVRGNPTTATDPSGHRLCLGETEKSCVAPPRSGSGAGGAPTIIAVATPPPVTTPHRNADGTLTLDTITTIQYIWSDQHVTTEQWTTSKTICDAKCHHLQRAHDLDRDAAGKAVWAGLLAAGAAFIDLLNADAEQGLEDFVVIAGVIVNLLPYAAQAFGVSSGVYEFIQRAASIMDDVASVVLSALAAIKQWGSLAEVVVNSAYLLVRTSTEGVPGAVETLAAKVLGSLATTALNAASAAMFAQYYQLAAEATHERNVAASLPGV